MAHKSSKTRPAGSDATGPVSSTPARPETTPPPSRSDRKSSREDVSALPPPAPQRHGPQRARQAVQDGRTRLRRTLGLSAQVDDQTLCGDAADEIERLRSLVPERSFPEDPADNGPLDMV